MESSSFYLMMAAVGGPLSLAAFFAVKNFNSRNRKIKDALFQMNLGYRAHGQNGVRDNEQEIEFANNKNELIFNRFNYGLSTLDFYKRQRSLEELFGIEIVEFERKNPFQVVALKADFKKHISKTLLERTDIVIGWDGLKKITFEDNRSAFVFAPSGTGKTHLLKNCFIRQLKKIDASIHIITSKKSDFDGAYSYHNPNDIQTFKAILNKTEKDRLHWEEIGFRNKKPIAFIFDEVQEANNDKELTSIIRSWVRVGRSQNIWVLIASQSGTVASLRNIEINLVPIKIAVRFTESVAFAETIFTAELAFKSHHIKQPVGFG